MVEKLYYSMGEVTEMFDVEPSLIRYWCSQFSCLRPKRNAKGNRMFTKQDIQKLKRIYHLLKEKKMTIEGAQKAMRKRSIEVAEKDSDMALLEQLQRVRAMLVEMRNGIGETELLVDEQLDDEPLVADEVAPVTSVAETVVESESVAEVEEMVEECAISESEEKEYVAAVAEEPVTEEPAADAPAAEPVVETKPASKPKKKRAPRRKLIGEEGVVERPLFPFFEQTLF